MKAFALVGVDGEVFTVTEDRQQLEDYITNDPIGGLYSADDSTIEFEYNDEPMTERGQELAAKIQELMKDVRNIHMNKQIGFYEIHVDDRLQMIYDMLTEPCKPFSFNDSRKAPVSKQPKTDVAELLKVEHYETSLDKELETHGICPSL